MLKVIKVRGVNMIKDNKYLFALDIGTRAVKGALGKMEDGKFKVLCENTMEHEERAMIDGQIHDINKVAKVVSEIKSYIEKSMNISIQETAIAAAGRFLKTVVSKAEIIIDEEKEIGNDMIRSLELQAVAAGEDSINLNSAGKLYCVGYSVKNYYLNGYLISNLLGHKGENIECEVIATFLPKSVVESLYSVMERVGLKVINMTLEPIAAMEAVIPKKLRLLNIALVDIGAGTSDIAICSKDSISAFGMVPKAGDEITEAIAEILMVDFISAEDIKRKLSLEENIEYTDVLGISNIISSRDLIKRISSLITKIAEEVGRKILELNNEKSPGAVFLVGGGAYTPNIAEELSKVLNIPIQRIAIKTRESVEECICQDYTSGSIGVTVLGIALTALKNLGKDFINVNLNGNIISMFNTRNLSVKDVLINGNINPQMLIHKNGRNVRFALNGMKRLSFGDLGKSAEIKVNDIEAALDTPIKDQDVITFVPAEDGMDAHPKLSDYLIEYDSKRIIYNGEAIYLEPFVEVNGVKAEAEYNIKDGDNIEIRHIKTIKDFIDTYISNEQNVKNIKVNCNYCSLEYNIMEGDIIQLDEASKEKGVPQDYSKQDTRIKVFVNDREYILKGKDKYVFIDVFNYIDFDLTYARGVITLELNNNKADYHSELKDGDIIKVYWK